MLLAKTQSLSNLTLHSDIAKTAIKHEFKNVTEDTHATLMQIFARHVLPYKAELRRVTRIGFLGTSGSGKTESCEWMRSAFGDMKRLTSEYLAKGQGVFEDPEIGLIRQYDAAANDHEISLPEYDDFEFWDDIQKHGVDLVEHADIDFADKMFDYIIVVNKAALSKLAEPRRDFTIFTSPEEASRPEFIECIERMQAVHP
jgi:hypothetical protein